MSAGDAVVQEARVAVQEGPEKSGREKREACRRRDITHCGLPHGHWAPQRADKAQAPRFHGQRLSAARPLHDKVKSRYQYEIKLEKQAIMREVQAVLHEGQDEPGEPQHSRQCARFVNQGQ